MAADATVATPATLETVRLFRDMYRLEMNCQVIHDSIHYRSGWTQEYLLSLAGVTVGYGSVALAGPWTGRRTIYEFYVVPTQRLRVFDLFRALLSSSEATEIEVQSNDPLATVMLHAFTAQVTSEAILFRDGGGTSHQPPGAAFREPSEAEAPGTTGDERKWRGIVEVDGAVAASGGVLFHYNPPFGDIYMDVAENWRRRGLGAFVVQELKRLCYERARIPAARCSPTNRASQQTLQKAGLVPCGHILKGPVNIRGQDVGVRG
jgi:GNAT superfamily N-acetyltransferase